MASSDLYEMRFEWPHREPNTVIVTGTFDHWSCSLKLNKTDSGFVGSVRVPWQEKIKYKFIVDGQWLTQAGQPTEMDPGGYINNIYLTPPRPGSTPAPEPVKLNSTYGFASVQTESVKEEAPVPVPEKPVEETPKEEKAVEKPRASERRYSIPIVPVNAVEHNTIHSSPPPPAIPDYMLPPPPRARSTSPPPVQEKPVEVVEETPKEEEKAVDKPKASERRYSIPIVPVNAVEHNTIHSSSPLPAIPDYVLPPSPRARSTSPRPVQEKPVEVVEETPKEEKAVENPRASERRMSIPIVPVNAVEHNTIHSSPPPPAMPDYVLPPSPRARSTSPPPAQETKQAAVRTPEPEPAKLHEVEVDPSPEEPIIPIAPEVPIEEQKQEAIAHIPVDDLPNAKVEFEEPPKEEEHVSIPTPEPAKEEDKPALPTPPATPHSKKEFPQSSPSLTPTGSPSSSRFGTAASKKKRHSSFFGKIKELFNHDKDKEKEKAKK